MIALNSSQTEAVAVADAHLNNCGLPSYTTLMNLVSSVEGLVNLLERASYVDTTSPYDGTPRVRAYEFVGGVVHKLDRHHELGSSLEQVFTTFVQHPFTPSPSVDD